MIYLDEKLPSHRKILKAGALIGEDKGGRLAALGLFVAAIGYAREHLTDGIVPGEYLHDLAKNCVPVDALRTARLIRKLRGNRYQIHDYLQWNKTADQIKKDRAKAAARVKRHRAGKTNRNGPVTPLRNGGVTHAPDPRSPIPVLKAEKQRAPRAGFALVAEPPPSEAPTVRQLRKLAHVAINEHPGGDFASLREDLKRLLSTLGFAADPAAIAEALEGALTPGRPTRAPAPERDVRPDKRGHFPPCRRDTECIQRTLRETRAS
jgi:hypothetical protein